MDVLTEYIIDGNDANKLYDVMRCLYYKKRPKASKTRQENNWLGHLVNRINETNEPDFECRGVFSPPSLNDGVLSFQTISAWHPCYQLHRLLESKFDVKVYFASALDIPETNDVNSKYFVDKYYLNLYIKFEDGSSVTIEKILKTKEEGYKIVSVELQKEVTEDNIEDIEEELQEIYEGNYVTLKKFSLVNLVGESIEETPPSNYKMIVENFNL